MRTIMLDLTYRMCSFYKHGAPTYRVGTSALRKKCIYLHTNSSFTSRININSSRISQKISKINTKYRILPIAQIVY